MGSMRRPIVLVAVAGLLLTACEEKKPARTNPPARAMAPAVQQPTPPAAQPAATTAQPPAPQRAVVTPTPVDPVPSLIEASERAYLLAKLQEHDWNVAETARTLDMPRSNLYKKIERYRLAREA